MKEGLEVEGLDALLAAGRRLLEVDPDAFTRVLAAARAFVAVHDRSDEDDAIFASRVRQIYSKSDKLLD